MGCAGSAVDTEAAEHREDCCIQFTGNRDGNFRLRAARSVCFGCKSDRECGVNVNCQLSERHLSDGSATMDADGRSSTVDGRRTVCILNCITVHTIIISPLYCTVHTVKP